jgi:hypothetical protein
MLRKRSRSQFEIRAESTIFEPTMLRDSQRCLPRRRQMLSSTARAPEVVDRLKTGNAVILGRSTSNHLDCILAAPSRPLGSRLGAEFSRLVLSRLDSTHFSA